jgi:hypothetical protein
MRSVTEQLKDLFALFKDGAITREQFDSKRDRLMAEDEEASVRSTSASSPGVPNQVGAYLITGHVGDGGMGSVYRGKHRSAQIASRQGGEVAIKVMHPHIARNKSFAERFEQEAGLGLKLDHPGICKVHDLVMDGGVLALVITNQSLTVASLVGFISLGGIAVRNGILLVTHYFHLMKHEGEDFSRQMILRGSLERLAPVLMTALTAGIALIPLVLGGHEPGREILYPVATVILGGLITSTFCEFLIHPGLFWKFTGRDAARMVNRDAVGDELVG